ncbi:M48 family metalloprotease [Dyella japonica]|uniref:M48 family metalloprotease n=1 Tax=Dyella japonica TaxID=231455 RepID=UPI0009E4149C
MERMTPLAVARTNQITKDYVVLYNTHLFHTARVSAHFIGLTWMTRVALKDKLIEKTSLPEIKAVLGHESGQCVLKRSLIPSIHFLLAFIACFLVVHRLLRHDRFLNGIEVSE